MRERARNDGQAIGIVVHDITNPYAAALVRGVQSVQTTEPFSLFVATGAKDLEAEIATLGARADGIICAAATQQSHIDAIEATGLPAVLVEFEPVDGAHGLDAVLLDNVTGARSAVDALIRLGHRRLGIIAGPGSSSVGHERLKGAQDAAEQAPDPVELLVETGGFTFDGGYQATARLLGRGQAPTAIFAPNNLTALGSLHCIHDLGIPIPDSLSFIGFDPLASYELFMPPPSTVERPEGEQGALAMGLLDSRLRGTAPATPRRLVLETTLRLRASCAPPPPARR